jgi:hypothetical protein
VREAKIGLDAHVGLRRFVHRLPHSAISISESLDSPKRTPATMTVLVVDDEAVKNSSNVRKPATRATAGGGAEAI